MDNPYVLRPGEVLSLEELVTRYLDWGIWNDEQNRGGIHTGCDPDLYNGNLCCQDHVNMSGEGSHFRRYFLRLIGREFRVSIYSMKELIEKHHLSIDINKITTYWHISAEEWEKIVIKD